jgi:uncharacterized DUF497 family protein
MTEALEDLFKNITGFEWDKGNEDKNWHTHNVSRTEIEQVFRNEPQVILQDLRHSQTEQRYAILGLTDARRRLLVIFTIRGDKIRPISARDQKKGAERHIYQSVLEAV